MSYTLGFSPVIEPAFHSYLLSRLVFFRDILRPQRRKNWDELNGPVISLVAVSMRVKVEAQKSKRKFNVASNIARMKDVTFSHEIFIDLSCSDS